MKRLVPILAALALVAGLTASSAVAKGASEATITGPGLDGGITLPDEGHPDGLFAIVEAAGFFPAVFVQSPDPTLPSRPEGKLGPRYLIEYEMPGPNNELDVIRQELYPYAEPEPLTYMEPGQGFYGTEETVGGWYVAGSILRDALVAVGLPETPPAGDGGDSGVPWTIAGLGLLCAVAIAGAAAAAAVLSRRRSGPAPAS